MVARPGMSATFKGLKAPKWNGKIVPGFTRSSAELLGFDNDTVDAEFFADTTLKSDFLCYVDTATQL